MLDFKDFMSEVVRNFVLYLPESLKEMAVRVEPIYKVNKVCHAINLLAPSDDVNVSPVNAPLICHQTDWV